eukprot:COSAG03_NODE_3848_length_1796_cov_3.434885_3_plen_71_part_00
MAQLCVAAGSSAESAECSHAWIELHHVFQGMGWLVRIPRPATNVTAALQTSHVQHLAFGTGVQLRHGRLD